MTDSIDIDVDVMVDIETLGTALDSPIIAIGAVAFHIDQAGLIGAPFYVNVDVGSGREYGPLNSFRWWLRQDDAARQRLLNPEPIRPTSACYEFAHWWDRLPGPNRRIWAHGVSFDIAMLERLFRVQGGFGAVPWKYSLVRDTRTLYEAAGLDYRATFDVSSGVKHDALEDAQRQALLVQKAWRRITEWAVRG